MPLATLSRAPRCRRPSIRGVTAVLAPLAALAIAAPAQAAIPGPVPVPPSPPPYGERIAVEMDGRIITMHPDGTDVRFATNPPDGVSDSAPDISADSKQVVFMRTAGGNDDVYVVNVDGSNARRLTSTYLYDGEPTFTPDGQSVLFTSLRGIFSVEIYSMPARPTAPEQGIVQLTRGWGYAPEVSPDGSTVVFSRDSNTYLMSIRGEAAAPAIRLTSQRGNDTDATFSPDGSAIAFTSFRNGPCGDLYELRKAPGSPTGWGTETNLTNTPAHERSPAYSPTGTQIAFSSRDCDPATSPTDIWVMGSSPNSTRKKVTDTPWNELSPSWGANSDSGPISDS